MRKHHHGDSTQRLGLFEDEFQNFKIAGFINSIITAVEKDACSAYIRLGLGLRVW